MDVAEKRADVLVVELGIRIEMLSTVFLRFCCKKNLSALTLATTEAADTKCAEILYVLAIDTRLAFGIKI